MHRARLLVEMAMKSMEKENSKPISKASRSPVLEELNSAPSISPVLQELNNEPSISPVLQELNNATSASSVLQEIISAPSTSCSVGQKKYYISPIRTDHSDFDDSDADPNFIPNPIRNAQSLAQRLLTKPPTRSSSSGSTSSSSSSKSSSSSSNSLDNETNNSVNPTTSTDGPAVQSVSEMNIVPEVEVEQRGRKRVRQPNNWKCKIAKTLRNSGKAYQSNTKKQAKEMGPACGEKCRLNCKSKIDETSRQSIFKNYWSLGDLQKQRELIIRHTKEIKPKYRYSSTQNLRQLNTAFHFQLNHINVRVCKTFFKNTLAINDRNIATALTKKNRDWFCARRYERETWKATRYETSSLR
ncbi:pinin-like [Eupeodes corollae]|uniref:pinin-like n=1 Tax=Eupeodes corollae TaxID=290404 RepID=UPI002492D168|nr:pinin-like [Eupeodes corollae]